MNTPAPAIIRSGTCCAIDEPMPGEDPRAGIGIDLALEHAEQTDLPLAVLSWFEQLGPPYRPLILPGFAPPSDSPAPRTVAQPALPVAALTGSALPRLGGDTPVNIVRTAWPATLTNALPASVGLDRVASRQSLVQNLLSGMPAPAATANQSTKGKAFAMPPAFVTKVPVSRAPSLASSAPADTRMPASAAAASPEPVAHDAPNVPDAAQTEPSRARPASLQVLIDRVEPGAGKQYVGPRASAAGDVRADIPPAVQALPAIALAAVGTTAAQAEPPGTRPAPAPPVPPPALSAPATNHYLQVPFTHVAFIGTITVSKPTPPSHGGDGETLQLHTLNKELSGHLREQLLLADKPWRLLDGPGPGWQRDAWTQEGDEAPPRHRQPERDRDDESEQ